MIRKKLGDMVSITTGKLNANRSTPNGRYPFFTCAREISRIDEYAFDGERVLVAGNGDLNVKYYYGKFNAYQRTYVIKSNDKRLLHPRYLFYFLDHYLEHLRGQSIGGVIKYIKLSHLTEVIIPLPTLRQQEQIISALDKALFLTDKRKQQIEMLDEFLKSVFLDMFGDPYLNPKQWEVGTIRNLVSEVRYGTSKKANEQTGVYPVLRMGNITYCGSWDFRDLKYMDLVDDELERYLVKDGDILFNRTNSKELVGKTAVYRRPEPMAYAGYLIRIRVNERATPDFMSSYLNSEYGKLILNHMCKNIVGMANINAQELQDISIYIPPKKLQIEYAKIVESVNGQKELFTAGLVELENAFNSIMQRAFKGELFS